MKTTKYIVTIVLALVCAWGNSFAVDQSYYNSVDGKSGKALFDAVHTVSKSGYKSLSYSGLWTAYCAIDINLSGKVWDMYSNVTSFTCGSNQCGSYGKEGDCYNREHSIPKSWFGGSESANTPGTDLFHVVPTDGYVNNIRSAYAFGEVASASYTSKSGCKKGSPKSITIENSILNKTGSSSQSCTASTVFEPMDEFKGDFARGYFGTMIKWANGDYQTFTTAEGAQIFNTSYDAAHYYGLKPYGVALLLKWHREDPVSQKEIDRNNGIQTKQGNRNPFIDYPELVEYIWGEHNGESVTLSSLTPTFEGYTPPEATTYTVILSRNGQLESITGATGTYNLPTSSDAACDGWTFAGWSATKVTSTTSTPSYITSVTSGGTVYAVYSKTTPSGAPIRKTAVPTGGTYKIYAEINSTKYYATGGLTSKLGNTTTAADATVFTFERTGDDIAIKVGTKYLSYSSGTNFNTSDDPYYWVFADGTHGTWRVTSKNTDTRAIVYRTGTVNKFAPYATSNINGTEYYDIEIEQVGGGGGGGSTTYDSEPAECQCSGNLGTPDVTATPSDQTITLTWPDVANATNGYTVTVSKGVGYTTECGETEIGEITHSGTTNTCIITGLVNDLTYTTSVVANATATICESPADEDAATPVGCESWNVTFGYSSYSLTAGGVKSADPTITGTPYGSVTYHSSDEAIITVEEDGKVTPVSAGTATITAHWTGDATHCPKDVISSEFTVTGLVRITFNANDGSETPATTTQDVTYNVATALTANSFSRTGYTFQGWSTDKNATSATYTDGGNITITAATTLYAVWQVNKHSVTFAQPESGGTFTVNSSSSSPVTNVDFGSTVTITITPTNSHFTVNTVSVSGASGSVAVSGEGNSRTFIMPDEDVTVSVTMNEETKYTVNWYVAGTPTAEQNYAGEALAGIADPEIECNGKTFQGWTATANYSSDDTAPNDLFNDASTKTMPSNNTTNYYAVFATETTSGSGSEGWSQVETLDAITDGTYVIENDGYALPSTTTSSAPVKNSTYALTISNKKITSTVSAAMQWSFAMSEGHVATITNASGDYLYATTANNGLRVGSTSDTWTFELNTSAPDFALYDDNSGRYCASYGTGDDWRSYTTATAANYANNGKVHLFKYSAGSTTTISDYTTSCTAPTEVTVTFHANYEGADPATATQTIPYNTATALTANSFSQTGYSFQGWATSPSGSKEYDDGASVTLTSNTHLYAVWQKNSHDVIFTPAPTGATVTINGQSTSPQSVEYGETVTIVITPDATYDLNSVSATGVSLSGEGNSRTFTMPDADVTVTVTMTPKPTHTIRFFDNGTKVSEQSVVDGQAAIKPSDPTPCDGYTFVGWWTATLAEDNTIAQTWITNFTATQDQDYYAVFSKTESSGSGSGTTVFTATAQGYSNGSSAGTKIIDGVTFAYADGGNSTNSPKFYTSSNCVHLYPQNTLTISSENNISSIVFGFSRNDGWTANTGTWEDETTWTGDATSIVFAVENTSGFQMRISTITVTVGGGGTTYYTTSCAPCLTKVTLTKGDETNGTFTLNKANGEYNNCTSNFVVTVSNITPADHYHCTGVTATGGNSEVSGPDGSGNYTVTYTKGNNITSTITANFAPNPTNAIRFFNNGVQVGETQNLYEGQVATKPSPDPTACEGYTFVGWWTAALATDNTTAETWVTDFTVSGAQDYYAVYSKTTEGGGTNKTYTLVLNGNNFAGSYAERSSSATANEDGGSGTLDVNFTSNGVMKSSNSGNPIQFRKSGSGAGVLYNTTDLGTINSITYGDGSTNNIASTYKGATAQPTSDGTGGYFKITNGASVSYITSITINFTKTTGSSTTYYTTNPDCCSEVVAPTVNATAKSTSATISWNNQANAVNGYSVTVKEGNSVVYENNFAAGVTSCNVTGLSSSTEYNYTVVAKGETCNSSASGNFTTTACDDAPVLGVVTVTATTATLDWTCSAATATIKLYSDAECNNQEGSDYTSATSPYTIEHLTSETTYYFKVFTGSNCSSNVGSFTTEKLDLDVAEWQPDAVVISYNGDGELTLTTYTEETHGDPHANVADDIFFSKYYEAASNVKLLAIFNGTLNTIDLSNYQLAFVQTGAGTTRPDDDEDGSNKWDFKYSTFSEFIKKSGDHLTADELKLKSNEELILISYQDGSSADQAIIACAEENESSSKFSTYIRLSTPELKFNGDDAVALVNPEGDFIDLIGAGTKAGGITRSGASFVSVSSGTTDKNGFMDNPGGWYTTKGYQVTSGNAEEADYKLSTNRCLLIRRKHIKSGYDAVARNTEDFLTLGDYNYLGTDYEGEWKGVQIPGSTGSGAGITNSCAKFEEVGSYNYNEYYIEFEQDLVEQTFENYKSDPFDGTYVIPVTGLSDLACSNIRIELKDGEGNLILGKNIKVPIMVTTAITTTDDIFHSNYKDADICRSCDLVIFDNAQLTKVTDGTANDVDAVRDVKVYPGGKLIVPGGTNYSVNSISFRREEDDVATADIRGNLNIRETGDYVFFDMLVDPTNWHYFSLPYDCNVNDITLSTGEPATLGTDYLIKWYDGGKRAATQSGGCWETVAADATLKKGIGYIFSIPGTGIVKREFRFPMSNEIITEEKDPEGKIASGVYAYGGDKSMTEVRANHRGWNLLGNPYLMPYSSDITDPLMTGYIVPDYPSDPEEIWDGHYKFDPNPSTNLRYIVEPIDNGWSGYRQVDIGSYEMKPFTSYFVQIGGDHPEDPQGVQFNLSAVNRSASPVRRAPAEYEEVEDRHPVWCAVTLTNPKGEKDETTLLISDNFTDGYDMMDDLTKWRGTYYQYTQITTAPVLASRNNEGEMAFNALPDSSALAGVPLNYFAASQGFYTIAYDDKYDRDMEVKEVKLWDKTTNQWYNLMYEPYSFSTARTDNKDRFVLSVRVERKQNQTTTDLENVGTYKGDKPRKLLINGLLYIQRGKDVYDVTGKQLLNR